MSTVAGMFYVSNNTSSTVVATTPTDQEMSDASGCSMADPETLTNLSDDDNTSCSNSEMGCDSINITTTSSNTRRRRHCRNNNNHNNNHILLHNNNKNSNNSISSSASSPSSSSARKNKRKNFKPRNIVEYAGSEEEADANANAGIESQRQGHGSRVRHDQDHQRQHEMSIASPTDDYDDDENDDDEEDEDEEVAGSGPSDPQHQRDDDASGSDSYNEDETDTPLDLSEAPSDSKNLWRKPQFLNNALSSKHGQHKLTSPQSEFNSPGHNALHNHHPLSHFSPVDPRLGLFSNPAAGDDFCGGNKDQQYFTESTMKELLGLYGIAENLRQGGDGKVSSTDISTYHQHLDSNGQQQSSKIVLPENMARFLAAIHESVNAANLKSSSDHHHHHHNNNSNSKSNSRSNHNPPQSPNHGQDDHITSPLNFTSSSPSLTQVSSLSGNGNDTSSTFGLNSQVHLNNNNSNSTTDNHSHTNNNSYNNTRSRTRRNRSPSDIRKHHNEKISISQTLLLNQPSNNNKGHHKSKSGSGKSSVSGRGLTSFPVIREGLLGKGSGPVDYTRYVRRFGSSTECGYQHCRDLNYREHFHCLDCCEGARVFVKKEEMIRHFKWHKKRDESLQHGFMRYSPTDDCGDRFESCPHNRKQTHYHCLQDGCEKVYISTSDVQMHANYHRKDSAIIQEGFQRFRAAEDCAADHCTFRHQHTTHFHCRRDVCSYTFKNKADMEKHKSYHVKDEQLNRDGFKKFMKHEICNFATCRFSRVCNHIHCIREGCNYVLHSSGQLYSHKRKHERRDSELAYRKFKLAQTIMRGTIGTDLSSPFWNDSVVVKSEDDENSHSSNEHGGGNSSTAGDSEDIFKKFISHCTCDVSEEEHYHCRAESCLNALLGNAEVASEHSRSHELEDRISSLAYFTVDPANFDAQDSTIPCVSAKCAYQNREKHYHCLWEDCSEIVLATDEPFKRLEHFRSHEKNQKLDVITSEKEDASSLDGFFRRKRGRPPKNRTIEVSSGANEAIFTSFKLPKPVIPGYNLDHDNSEPDLKDPIGFMSYPARTSCPDASCSFNSSSCAHYHCAHPRCHFAVKDVHKLSLHLRDFHSNVDILDGYAYFDRGSNCHEAKCEFNGSSNHFHCTRDGYIFQRYSSMTIHEAEYHESKYNAESSDDDDPEWNGGKHVKSSGTFFPKSSIKDKGNQNNNNNVGNNPMDLSSPSNGDNHIGVKSVTDHSLSRILQLPESSETQFGPDSACGRPFCKLKRKCHFHCHLCNQAFSEVEKLRPHVLKHSNLSTPIKPAVESDEMESEDSLPPQNDSNDNFKETFIRKLRKDDLITNNNSSPTLTSQLDLSLTSSSPAAAFTPTSLSNFLGYPTSHSPYLFLQQNPFTSLYAGMMFGQGFPPPPTPELLSRPPSSPSSLLIPLSEAPGSISPLIPSSILSNTVTPLKRPPSNSSSPSSPPSESKKLRMQLRILKDEPVPEGYVRFRFNEDCSYIHCGYREHQTHFHCTREDCGYSFCDKTRFVQHTARHERLDTLMGGDFKQYRANVACGREDCSYLTAATGIAAQAQQNKASHFHCSKCEFVCTDTNKVVAHRRQHQKLDSIMAAGFEKFTPSQNCNIDACIHAQKQTHYHCLKCNYAVLGLSQMSAHKYRHAD